MIPFFPSSGQALGSDETGVLVFDMIQHLYPLLNATTEADLVFFTEAELYHFLDKASKEAARRSGGFIERDASTPIVPGTSTYSLPARHISTINLALDGKALLNATAGELEALDDTWVETTGAAAAVERWIEEGNGAETLRLYPAPASGTGTLSIVFHRYPATPTVLGSGQPPSAAGIFWAPDCLLIYFVLLTLSYARAKESEGAMLEVAVWAREMCALIEAVMETYWGGAQ